MRKPGEGGGPKIGTPEFREMLASLGDMSSDWIEKAEQRKKAEQQRQRDEQEVFRKKMLTERRERIVSRFANRLVPEMADAIRSDSLSTTDATRAVDEWLSSDDAFLVLSGGTGTGKTTAAINALATLGGEFVRAYDLAVRFDPWTSDRERGIEPLDTRAPLIVVDDWGVDLPSNERFRVALDELVDARKGTIAPRCRARTMFTTNLTPHGLEDRYRSDRLFDRLQESGRMVILSGESMRRKR